ncbi:hypothetical protein [Rothia amarae]|uniref:hypothetical protein n=1 Tax=Rothia amarae TaxID=169480 RepID=UPI00340B4F5E
MTPDWLVGGLKGLIEKGLDAAVRWFLTQIFAALETILNGLGSWWLGVEAPGMGPGSASEAVSNSTIYFVAVAGIIGTAIGIIRVVRTHSRESVADLAMAIFATIATTAIGGTVASYLLTITSQLSPWLLETISGASGDERKSLYTALGFMPADTTAKMAIGIAMIAILLVVLAAIASLVNMFFVLFTYGVIAVLVGLLPIFAAQSQTEAGKQRFWKVVGWIFAAVLYKPTAAIIYGVGILWIKGIVPDGQESNEMAQIITLLSGFMITAMSCIALPALIRLVSVSTREHASGISAGGAIAAGAGAVAVGSLGLAAVATGGASAVAGAGASGAAGAGSAGSAGAAGATGAGSTGAAGAGGVGSAGASGTAGVAGAGESGAAGAAGSAGSAGASGAEGAGSTAGAATSSESSASGSVAAGSNGADGSTSSGAMGTSGNPGSTGSGSVPAGTSPAGGGAPSPSTHPSAPSVASGSQGTNTPAQPAPAMDAPAPSATPTAAEPGSATTSRSASTHSPASSTTATGSSPASYRPAQQVLSPNMSRALGTAARGTSNAANRHMRDVENQLEN